MFTRLTRRLASAVAVVAALVVLHTQTALAMVSPDDPGPAATTQTLVVSSVDWSQLALAAAIACLVGIAATLAVMVVMRHTRRPALHHG